MFWSAMVSRSFFTNVVIESLLLGAKGNGVEMDGRLAERRVPSIFWILKRPYCSSSTQPGPLLRRTTERRSFSHGAAFAMNQPIYAGGQSLAVMSVFCKCVFCPYLPQHAVASCVLFREND